MLRRPEVILAALRVPESEGERSVVVFALRRDQSPPAFQLFLSEVSTVFGRLRQEDAR